MTARVMNGLSASSRRTTSRPSAMKNPCLIASSGSLTARKSDSRSSPGSSIAMTSTRSRLDRFGMRVAGFSGVDGFLYFANDGSSDSLLAAVTIRVNSAGTPPVAENDSFSVAEDGTLGVGLSHGLLANDK